MKPSFHAVTIRWPTDVHDRIVDEARRETRSVTGQVIYITRAHYARIDQLSEADREIDVAGGHLVDG